MINQNNKNPIGVFDSGVGGLTVYKALQEALPHEDFIYLGDTARLPYGTKSPETVGEYALQAARVLLEEDIKLLVVACNTASALALPTLRENLPELPCIGVIEPSAEAAADASCLGRIAVLATESTVRSGAYEAAIRRHHSNVQVEMLGCNLMVSIAEEGWSETPEGEAIVARYLSRLQMDYDTLVLGCTHFPLMANVIRKQIAPDIPIISSAHATTQWVVDYLNEHHMRNTKPHPGHTHFMVTDSPERFENLAWRFLDTQFVPSIELVNLLPNSHSKKPVLKTVNAP